MHKIKLKTDEGKFYQNSQEHIFLIHLKIINF